MKGRIYVICVLQKFNTALEVGAGGQRRKAKEISVTSPNLNKFSSQEEATLMQTKEAEMKTGKRNAKPVSHSL